jgi:septal ring factor EnvC (AmiA/AmiB activator)
MNTVETLALVVAEQARKITELEAFIASKMVVTVQVTKPAESGLGCIAPSCDTEAAKARAQEAARKAAKARAHTQDVDAGDESDTYHFYDKLISSKGEISLVWNVANSK